jgi:hypothetical protein
VLDLQPQDLQLPPALGSTQLGVGHGLQQLQLPVDRHVPALESQQLVAALRLWQQGQQQQLQLLTPSLPLQQGNVSAPLAAAQPQWQQQPPSVSAALKCEDITLGKAAAAAGVADATHTVASTGLPAAYTAPAVDQAAGELHLRPTEAVPATAAAAADGSDNCSERDSDAVMDGWDELVAAAGPALTGEDDELLLGQALDIFFTAP